MMYYVCECPHCKSLSVHTGSGRVRCPHCARTFSVVGNVVHKTEKIHEALAVVNQLEKDAGKTPHIVRFKT